MIVSVGNKSKRRIVRKKLLNSAWFSDSQGRTCEELRVSARAVFQPGGTCVLPAHSQNAAIPDIESLLKSLIQQLGPRGKEAIESYLEKCQPQEGTVTHDLLTRTFYGAQNGANANKRRKTLQTSEAKTFVSESLHIGFLNWRQLTDKQGNIRLGPYLDGLEAASTANLDVLLGAEMGTTTATLPINGGRYTSNWSVHPKPVPGVGVGAFFDEPWADKWSLLPAPSAPSNSRFYLLKSGSCCFIVGVFHAPHQGYSTQLRLKFYSKLRHAWRTIRAQHPTAKGILCGDANIPDLYPIAERKSKVAKYFAEHFLDHLSVANAATGEPAATHTHGHTLDLLLHDPDLVITDFTVQAAGLAGSDHNMITAKFKSPPGAAHATEVRWKYKQNISWEDVSNELEPALQVWHKWFDQQLRLDDRSMNAGTLNGASILLSVITLASIWRVGSPFGRFVRVQWKRSVTAWWDDKCATALRKVRTARGTAHHGTAKSQFRQTVKQAGASGWRQRVDTLVENAPSLPSQLHSHVRQFLHPKKKPTSTLRIDNNVIGGQDAANVWAAFLKAQSSIAGPVEPAQLLAPAPPIQSAESTPPASEHALSGEESPRSASLPPLSDWDDSASSEHDALGADVIDRDVDTHDIGSRNSDASMSDSDDMRNMHGPCHNHHSHYFNDADHVHPHGARRFRDAR